MVEGVTECACAFARVHAVRVGAWDWRIAGRRLLSSETVGVMQGRGHRGGFSVHAAERVAAQDSAGRERLLRYRSLIRHWVEHRLAWCSRLRSALNVYDCRCWIKNNVQSAYVTRLLFLGITNKSD